MICCAYEHLELLDNKLLPCQAQPHTTIGGSGGFMGTAAPNGKPWLEYCRGGEPEISSGNFIVGPWGECLAWAVIYEHQNKWEDDPQYESPSRIFCMAFG